MGQGGELVGAVVHDPHFHPLGGLLGQDFQHGAPHQPFCHDKILQKDELFRFLKLQQQLAELILPQGEVGEIGVFVYGKTAATVDVPGHSRRTGAFLPELFHGFRVLGDGQLGIIAALLHQPGHSPVADVPLGKEVQKASENGKKHNDHQPGDFSCGVHPAVEQIQNDQQGKNGAGTVNAGQPSVKPEEKPQQHHHLQEQQHHNQGQSIEEQPGEGAFLFFHQGENVWVLFQGSRLL